MLVSPVVVFVVGDVLLAVTIVPTTLEEFWHASPSRMVAVLVKVMSAHCFLRLEAAGRQTCK